MDHNENDTSQNEITSNNSQNTNVKNVYATSLRQRLKGHVAVDTCADCDILPHVNETHWDDIVKTTTVNGAFGAHKQNVPLDRAGDIRSDGQPLMSVGKFINALPGLCFKWEHGKFPVFYGRNWPRIVCHNIGRIPYLRPDQYLLLRNAWLQHHASQGETANDFDDNAFPTDRTVVKCTMTQTNLDESTIPTGDATIMNTKISQDTPAESSRDKMILKTVRDTIKRLECDQLEMDQRDWLRHDLSVFATDTGQKFLELPSAGIQLVATRPEQIANIKRHYHRKIKTENISKGVLSVDLSGPHRRTNQGYEYFMVGAYTNLAGDRPAQPFVRFSKTKNESEICTAILSMIAEINSREAKQCIFRVHSDKGKEFVNKTLDSALKSLTISQTFTGADDPQANGTSERLVGQLKRDARALLCRAQLEGKTFLWPFAIRHACFLRREPVRVTRKLPQFGTQVVVRIRNPKTKPESKCDFTPRGQEGTYLGVCETVRPLGAFVRYKNGSIDEVSHLVPVESESEVTANVCTGNQDDCAHCQNPFDVSVDPPATQNTNSNAGDHPITCGTCRRGKGGGRHTKRPGCLKYVPKIDHEERRINYTRLKILHTLMYGPVIDESKLPESQPVDIPISDMRKMTGAERNEWFESTMSEVNSLLQRGVITIVDSHDSSIRKDPTIERLPSSVIYTLKAAATKGGSRRKKCRVVVCGNHSTTFEEVYTATLDSAISRLVTRYGAGKGYTFGSIDVRTAFLYAPIPEDRHIVIRPPKFLVELGVCNASDVWVLNRALYGLRESPRLWGQHRDEKLRDLTFRVGSDDYFLKQSMIDEALWDIRKCGSHDSDASHGLLSTYVDDLLGCSRSEVLAALFSKIRTVWDTTEPSYLTRDNSMRFLGVDLEMLSDGSIFMGQQRYVHDVLKKFNMTDTRPVDTLADVDTDGDEFTTPVSPADNPELFKRCQSCIGALLWLSTRTRSDLAYAVSRASQLLSKNIELCWSLCKRMLRYLVKHDDIGIVMTPFDDPEQVPPLESFTDASFSPTGGASQTGIIILWGGCPVLWRSTRQSMIAQSTAESELVALASCLNTTIGFSNVLETVQIHCPVKLYSDNKACLTNAKEGSTWRSRHYLLRAAALRRAVKSGLVHLNFVHSRDQVADYLTKYLGRELFQHQRDISGLRSRATLR